MKKLDQFILKSFVGPFIAILLVVIFILMMQFLWLYIDELVGKGLSFKVILEFLGWGSITLIPLSLPLATLLASMMTLGTLGENNELLAIKAAGISLRRVLVPLIFASAVISIGAFFISNNLIPVAYNKIFTLRDDIGRTKEEIKIPTGTFYDGIDGYVLRVDTRNDETGMMYGVMVYNHTGNKGNTSLTLADSAMMKMTADKKALTFTLFSGENYEETNTRKFRDTTLQLQKIDFDRQSLVIPLENYAFQKSEDTRFDDEVKSMNLKQLEHSQDSIGGLATGMRSDQLASLRSGRAFKYNDQLDTARRSGIRSNFDYSVLEDEETDFDKEISMREKAINSVNEYISTLTTFSRESYHYTFLLRRIDVEILKKFALSLACFIFFFIGAPLGALIRKGGLGTPAIISVLFFVLYWVIDITGTKLANDGAVGAPMGVFISSYILFPIGIFLTYKAINDSSILNMDKISAIVKKIRNAVMGRLRKTRIVFMGTPEFAVASLDALVQNGYNVIGVVTVADKASGRGLKVHESPVKKYATEHNIPVLQPVSLKDPAFLEALGAWKADLFVVVAFRMLPKAVWEMPRLGTFNLHASLLPKYRGAAPIQRAIWNGEEESGVTTFLLDKDMDTGAILFQEKLRLDAEETAGSLHDKLMSIGAPLVVKTARALFEGTVQAVPQPKTDVPFPEAPKIFKKDCVLDYHLPAGLLHRQVKALSPYPGAIAYLHNTETNETTPIKVLVSHFSKDIQKSYTQGGVISDGRHFLGMACSEESALFFDKIQLPGKKALTIEECLRGFRLGNCNTLSFSKVMNMDNAN